MTQQMLADRIGLSRTTIGRMITNKDNRGNTYHTSEEVVVLICWHWIQVWNDPKNCIIQPFRNEKSGGSVLQTETPLKTQQRS